MSRSRISFQGYTAFEEPTVNLTPLIDVVFVILIMFIVIAPLLELDRIELANGTLASLDHVHSAQESSPITIHVHADNTIWFNSTRVNQDELRSALLQAKQNHPKVNPQVFHDKKAHFGIYQLVKNTVEETGFSTMDIILKPA